MTEPKYTRDGLISEFQSGIFNLKFKTTKGVETTKIATLREEILPPPPVNESTDDNDELKKKRKVNPDVINFWSVEDGGWRACRIENIIEITPVADAVAVAPVGA